MARLLHLFLALNFRNLAAQVVLAVAARSVTLRLEARGHQAKEIMVAQHHPTQTGIVAAAAAGQVLLAAWRLTLVVAASAGTVPRRLFPAAA